MNAVVEISIDTALGQTGQRQDIRRRLSDKILAAFNHAYSVGEFEIAKQLRAVLANNENQPSPYKEMRKGYDPLGEADLWVSFVNMRNTYRQASEGEAANPDAVAEALEAMKEAYRQWSQN